MDININKTKEFLNRIVEPIRKLFAPIIETFRALGNSSEMEVPDSVRAEFDKAERNVGECDGKGLVIDSPVSQQKGPVYPTGKERPYNARGGKGGINRDDSLSL